MNTFLVIYLLGVIVAWPLFYAAMLGHFQRKFSDIADETRRNDFRYSVVFAFGYAFIWPLGWLLLALLLDGYEHGLQWRVRW